MAPSSETPTPSTGDNLASVYRLGTCSCRTILSATLAYDKSVIATELRYSGITLCGRELVIAPVGAWASWTSCFCCSAGVFPALERSKPELALVPLWEQLVLFLSEIDACADISFKRWKQGPVREM